MSKGKFNDVKDDIISYIREGDSNILACKKVGISKETFYTWINDKPDFSDSLKKARKSFVKLSFKRWSNHFGSVLPVMRLKSLKMSIGL